MPKSKHRAFRSIALLLATALIAANILAFLHAGSMTKFSMAERGTGSAESLSLTERITTLLAGVKLVRPESIHTIEEFHGYYRALTIPGPDQIRLGAWYGEPEKPHGLVILCHGYGAEKSSLLAEAEAFRQLGYAVLLLDFRGSGESSESYTTIGYREAEDIEAAVRFVDDSLPQTNLILYGQSMGAAAVLRAAAEFDVHPSAIIIESVFDRLLHTVRNRFHIMQTPAFPFAELLVFWGGVRYGFNGFAFDPVDYAAKVRCPVLIFHGELDPRATLAEARSVFEAVPTEKEFVMFPRAGHISFVERFPQEWQERVGKFLETYRP